ncbi:MAG: adenylate/guanylate cyclase domain-containing protein [Gammaproteobacteria bacterium]|nr:adenylate/guanylate cyclase domain-containing protein [Gammaproteobacteria bacterium]
MTSIETTHGHILVVDDEITNRDILQRMLVRQGYSVSLASGGRQAQELIRLNAYDLVLLDIMMPEVDGIAVLKAARQQFSMTELPIIMATALDETDQVANALSLGANDYLTKPFNKKILLARVHTQTALAQAYNKAIHLAEDVSRRNKLLLKLFGRYVTDEVAKNLLESPSASKMGGELQKVAVLFADIRNFTEISEHLPPGRVVEMLNNFFDVMIDVIRKYRGTVDKLIGDEVLATFGTTRERPDDTERALACALEMQLGMAAVNARNRASELPELKMGIGINTGDVMVGNIGSEKHSNYSVIGKHVNLAARIQGCAAGDEIMISESAFLGGRLEVWVDGKREFTPKGIDHPIIVYRLSGLGGRYQLSLERNVPEISAYRA